MEDHLQFSTFFYPKSIAVIGVSGDKNNLGRNIVQNCFSFGYEGEIFSVGLRKGVVFGQRIYRSLEEIDREIDLVAILTPAKTIPGILEQCGRKGIKHAVIESSGFSEMGEEGKPLEKASLDTARKYGIRFVGPNGIGVTNLEIGLALPFMPLRTDLTLGPVSVLAQSGGVGLSYLNFLADESVGINKFVSMGNKLNVDENDLLSYLIHDKETKIILLYLEGFTNGRRFVEIASKSEKPILVYKSNRFEASARIAQSHTAALFADDRLVDHALEQAGCIRINTLDEELDLIRGLNHSTGRNVGVYPEIKNPKWHREHGIDLSRLLLDKLAEHGYRRAEDPVFVQCFDAEELHRVRRSLGCRLRLVQLVSTEPAYAKLLTPAGLRGVAEYANGLGPSYSQLVTVDPKGTPVPTSLAAQAHAANLAVHAYTFRRDALPPYARTLEQLVEAFLTDVGIDGLFCDQPDVAVRVRDAWTERQSPLNAPEAR